MLAPIVLFTYNRPWHTKQTLDALSKNDLAAESILYVYSDGAKINASVDDQIKIDEVRSLINNYKGFKEIILIKRNNNLGLANNIINGVSEILMNHKSVIVLEDDLITSPYFLKFMNEGLNIYENNSNIISIHGYVYGIMDLPNIFFIKGADCLGWATWKDKWSFFENNGNLLLGKLNTRKKVKLFNFNNTYNYFGMLKEQVEGKVSSWAIRWYASAFVNDMLTLYPGKSLVYHIGNDGSGTNYGKDNFLHTELSNYPVNFNTIPLVENLYARKKFELFFKSLKPTLIARIKSKLNSFKNVV
jgi:hypothetical protein